MARAPKIENDKCENSSVALNLHNHVKLLQTDRRRVGLDGELTRALVGSGDCPRTLAAWRDGLD